MPQVINQTDVVDMFVVYDRPRDQPDAFVVRRHYVFLRNGAPQFACDASPVAVTPTLDAARAAVPRRRTRIPRDVDDDPAIVEVWL